MVRRCIWLAAAVMLMTGTAFGQGNPTGTISGRVLAADGAALPGVTVVAESTSLQGVRTVVTSDAGDYLLPQLPPGDYTLTFSLDGFRTIKREMRLGATQKVPIDITLQIAAVEETVTVTAAIQDFGQTSQISSNYRGELLDKLPTTRTLESAVLLAPGVQATGPDDSITIAGSMSFENLFMVNGVVVNENLRGQAHRQYIEDSIQETTIQQGNISAEYGRFSGGVVNAITKSGGNRFSGSYRLELTNDDWTDVSPFGETRLDKTIPTHSLTLGGPIMRDRLWFFGAGLLENLEEGNQTSITNVAYTEQTEERRWEGKLTYSLTPNHTFRGSYLYRNRDEINESFQTVMDLRSLYNRSLPEDLLSVNYSGIITPQFSVEAQFSQKHFTFKNSGSTFTDLINGTLMLDRSRSSRRYWAPTFCGVCDDEKRDNQNVLVKANYFLTSPGLGSHNFVAGFDTFNDMRFVNNHQSGSGYRILGTGAIIRGTEVFPILAPGTSAWIQYNPIFNESLGTDFRTHSAFINDTWRASDRLTLNLGLRYDKNDGTDSFGTKVVRDGAFSPRLGLTYDPSGTGRWTVNAGYGKYVAAIANGIANDASSAGQAASFTWFYNGPPINTDPNVANPIPTDQAIQMAFDWFFANGGLDRPRRSASVPGLDTRIDEGLRSPSVHEWTGGVSRQLGSRGLVRADFFYRDYRDFYATQTDTTTGQVENELGEAFDLGIVRNTNEVEREYIGLHTQFTYRIGNQLNVGGNWTVSRARGNFDGETSASGPVTTGALSYPEFTQASWNRPIGPLAIDQTHKVRAWATYTLPAFGAFGTGSISVLQQYDHGVPYELAANIDPSGFVSDLGYVDPPTAAAYYFSDRGAFRFDASHRTDLSLNWDAPIAAGANLFFRAQVLNVFNNAALINFNTQVLTASNTDAVQEFNPFTETPQENVHWRRADLFGQATEADDYQLPRTFRFSVGLRF